MFGEGDSNRRRHDDPRQAQLCLLAAEGTGHLMHNDTVGLGKEH